MESQMSHLDHFSGCAIDTQLHFIINKNDKTKQRKKKVTCFGGFAYMGNHMEFTFYMVSTQEIILTMIEMKKWSLSF